MIIKILESGEKMKKILLSLFSVLVAAAFTACSSESTNKISDMLENKEEIGIAGDGYDAPEALPDGICGDYEDCVVVDDIDPGNNSTIPATAGTLTAGEWNDNNHWTFWQSLYQKNDTGWESYRKIWDKSFCSRTFVSLSVNGSPVKNAHVTLEDANGKTLWISVTDNEGKAYLFYTPDVFSGGDLKVKTVYGGEAVITPETAKNPVIFNFDVQSDEVTTVKDKSLDLALVVDTTGSMSDELSYLQKELESVISRAAKDNGNIPVRLSVSFYRDDGDEYVVRSFDFTDDIPKAVKDLNAQNADGGGDYPEKVNAALDNGINKLNWEDESTKLMFIILDAPPHGEDRSAVKQMNDLVLQASQKGIRLIPILASGGDKETEFLMRDFALKTNGTYLFLTDDSGVSTGQHIDPTVGDYAVEKLNDLMVKVINRYLKKTDKPAEYTDEKVEIKDPVTDSQKYSANEVTMKLIDSEYDSGELKFEISNKTENDYVYGYGFDLECLKDGQWVKLEPLDSMSVIEIAVILQAGTSNMLDAPVKEYFGELSSGKYRIVLKASSSTGEHLTLYGEFEKDIIID